MLPRFDHVPAPGDEGVAPPLAATYAATSASAPGIEHVALAPAAFNATPAPAIEYVALAPDVSYTAPAPVIGDVTPAPNVTYATPIPVCRSSFVWPAEIFRILVSPSTRLHIASSYPSLVLGRCASRSI